MDAAILPNYGNGNRPSDGACEPDGPPMINSIDVRNFKCFEHLKIDNCRRVNLIVGNNGSGKTALLESVFMALGVTSEFIVRFRQLRGADGTMRGSSRKIADAIWRDYFFDLDMNRSISITLSGVGPEARSLRIDRGQGESLVPLDDAQGMSISPLRFCWKDANGNERVVTPVITAAGVQLPETGEDHPDFFFFAANQTFSAIDNADRFSELSRSKGQAKFVKLFTKQYPWIEDLSIEVVAGSPAIYASVQGVKDKLPITSVSGGINRMITFMLAIASRSRSVVLIDEIENGIYHSHHVAFWQSLLLFSREYNSQIFMTTHSREWLEAFAIASDQKVDDIALWRTERTNKGIAVRQFSGTQVPAGINAGEVR